MPAKTSRGVYTTRDVWYVTVFSQGRWGVGECAPLPGLSCDDLPEYAQILAAACRKIEETGRLDKEALRPYPSILFGMETAFRHFEAGSFKLWDTPYSRGETDIPINGLIWMGSYEDMLRQTEEKIAAGFRCIKLKIGAIDFEEELALLRHIRRRFTAREIELRVDANGAFSPEEATDKLRRLAELDIHSIEQPIRAGQWKEMARLASHTPIPIALDEELIGCNWPEEKEQLLDAIRPQYIILKPSLHGGFSGCEEWIAAARRRNIGWWATSALESNIGLNAISQWCATLGNPLPQGLGTGELFTNNLSLQSSLYVTSSGSTGAPREIQLKPEQMIRSAELTCDYLGLRPGDRALLCMPLQYIGAKMMVVRTIVAGLELWVSPPSGRPLKDLETPFRFVAMTPLQVYNSLQTPIERERLRQIEILLIGGGAIDPALEKEVSDFPHAVYSTYGMTETLSHIALRRLNGPMAEAYYSPLPTVKLSLTEDDCLLVSAPHLGEEAFATNDRAELSADGRFRILGRKDNVVNSGGVKLQIEQLEDKLRPAMPAPFALSSTPDPALGEALVLLIEEGDYNLKELQASLAALLPRYERPRHIRQIASIPLAGNGKIDRAALKTYQK